jgi:flagellar motor switch protein FliN/FliY
MSDDFENEGQNLDDLADDFSNDETSKQADEDVEGKLAEFPEFDDAIPSSLSGDDKFSMLKDLKLNVFIELGRTKMEIKDILDLERGYVIELDKLASEPVDVFVNNKKIAEAEVVVIDKHFGIRITNLVSAEQRMQGIQQ